MSVSNKQTGCTLSTCKQASVAQAISSFPTVSTTASFQQTNSQCARGQREHPIRPGTCFACIAWVGGRKNSQFRRGVHDAGKLNTTNTQTLPAPTRCAQSERASRQHGPNPKKTPQLHRDVHEVREPAVGAGKVSAGRQGGADCLERGAKRANVRERRLKGKMPALSPRSGNEKSPFVERAF